MQNTVYHNKLSENLTLKESLATLFDSVVNSTKELSDEFEKKTKVKSMISTPSQVDELYRTLNIITKVEGGNVSLEGIMDDVTPEMKKLLDFIDGKEPEDEFTRELDEAVQSVRKNEKWRLEYMTLQMNYQEKYEQGVEQEKRQSALRMIGAGKLSSEEIALYSGLTLEQVLELKREFQPV